MVIEIEKVRGRGARAFLDVVFPALDGRREMREELALDRKGATGFRHVFQNLQRDLNFRAKCGDFTGKWYRIRVRPKPRIEEIVLQYEFPEYTGISSQGEEASSSSGHIKVPSGTRVRYQARTSIPVSRVIRFEARPSGDGEELLESVPDIE